MSSSTVEEYLSVYLGEVDEALTHLSTAQTRSREAVEDAAELREEVRGRVRDTQDRLLEVQEELRTAQYRHTVRASSAAKIARRIDSLKAERERVVIALGDDDAA